MTPDEFCFALFADKAVTVDVINGHAYSKRFAYARKLGATNQAGYVVCTLHLGSVRKQIKLHRLVWLAARGPIPVGMVPDHINRVKSDNRISNLRLVTPRENAHNRRSYVGAANPAARYSVAKVDAIRRELSFGCSYQAVATRHGVSKSLVAQISRGEAWR